MSICHRTEEGVIAGEEIRSAMPRPVEGFCAETSWPKDSPRTTTEIMVPTNRPAAAGDNRLARHWAPKQHRRNAFRAVESASCRSGKRTFERERTKLRDRIERLGLDNAALKVCRCAEKGHRALAQDPLWHEDHPTKWQHKADISELALCRVIMDTDSIGMSI